MRFLKILFLHLQHVFQQRAIVFVYLLIAIIPPFLLALFWRGVTQGGKVVVLGWTFQEIASYYLCLALLGGILMAYVEDSVAKTDIRDGQLVMYLMKPFSYLLKKFYEEFSFRIFRVGFGVVAFLLFYFLWGSHFLHLYTPLIEWPFIFCILLLGFFVSFFFKMIVGLTAFWMVDVSSVYDLVEVLIIVCAGYLMPLVLMPTFLAKILIFLPFAYIIYFPILAFMGKFSVFGLLQIIGTQAVWLFVFYGLYQLLWRMGVKRYSGVGQ